MAIYDSIGGMSTIVIVATIILGKNVQRGIKWYYFIVLYNFSIKSTQRTALHHF